MEVGEWRFYWGLRLEIGGLYFEGRLSGIYWSLRSKSCMIYVIFNQIIFGILSEATLFMRRPTAHMKIKKRCAWKKEHETLTLGKRLRGQPGKKGGKIGLRLEIGDLYFGGPALDIVWSLRSKSCKIFKKILHDLCDFLSDYFWILSEATLFMRRPTAHMKIKKRCAWKKEHETLTLGKRLRGQPEEKGGKKLVLSEATL